MKHSSSYPIETPRGTFLHILLYIAMPDFQRQSSSSESNFLTSILEHNAHVHLGTKTNIQKNLFFSQETRYEVTEEQLFLIVLYSFSDPLEIGVLVQQWDFRTLIWPLCVPSCFPIIRVEEGFVSMRVGGKSMVYEIYLHKTKWMVGHLFC